MQSWVALGITMHHLHSIGLSCQWAAVLLEKGAARQRLPQEGPSTAACGTTAPGTQLTAKADCPEPGVVATWPAALYA